MKVLMVERKVILEINPSMVYHVIEVYDHISKTSGILIQTYCVNCHNGTAILGKELSFANKRELYASDNPIAVTVNNAINKEHLFGLI